MQQWWFSEIRPWLAVVFGEHDESACTFQLAQLDYVLMRVMGTPT